VNFVGVIRLDGHVFAMDQLMNAVRALARENNWTEQVWEGRLAWIFQAIGLFGADLKNVDYDVDTFTR